MPLILAHVFAEQYRVIAVSLHYFSEPWDGRGDDFSILQHADDLAEGSTKCSAPAPASELRHPLNVFIVVGLLVSHLLTLFTMPVIISGSTALRSVLPDVPRVRASQAGRIEP